MTEAERFPFWEEFLGDSLDAPAAVQLIRRSGDGNETFLVRCLEERSILRVYGATDPVVASVHFETDLLAFLSARGVPVAAAIPTEIDKELWKQVETSQGSRVVALFTFAEGNVHWPPTDAQSRALGATLARLHIVSDDFPISADGKHRVYDDERLLDSPLRFILPYLGAYPDEAAYLERLAEQIREILGRVPTERGIYGVVHGDIHQGNCHFQDNGNVTFFDFSNCGIGLRAWDITGFLWPLRDDTINDPAIKAACDGFLAGYESVRPLAAAEHAAIPAFVKARDFWETGNWLMHDKTADPAVVASGLLSLVAQFRAKPLI